MVALIQGVHLETRNEIFWSGLKVWTGRLHLCHLYELIHFYFYYFFQVSHLKVPKDTTSMSFRGTRKQKDLDTNILVIYYFEELDHRWWHDLSQLPDLLFDV